MGKFARSWALAKASMDILRSDRELLVFPLVSAIAVVVVALSFILPMFGLGLFEHLASDRADGGDGLPPALMFCGTRDTLAPGCRLLARRAADSAWDLTYVEIADLIHVFPILPGLPEARAAWRQTLDFLT